MEIICRHKESQTAKLPRENCDLTHHVIPDSKHKQVLVAVPKDGVRFLQEVHKSVKVDKFKCLLFCCSVLAVAPAW